MLEQDELGEPLSDRLTVGAFPTALAALVPRALARVMAEHPALEVKIREGGTEAQLRRLRAGRIDVGVIAAGAGFEYDLADLEFEQLMRGQAHLIVSAEHRFAERGWVNVADLEGERWILGEADRTGPQVTAVGEHRSRGRRKLRYRERTKAGLAAADGAGPANRQQEGAIRPAGQASMRR